MWRPFRRARARTVLETEVAAQLFAAQEASRATTRALDYAIERYRLLSELAAAESVVQEVKKE